VNSRDAPQISSHEGIAADDVFLMYNAYQLAVGVRSHRNFPQDFFFFGNNLKLQDLQDFSIQTRSIHLLHLFLTTNCFIFFKNEFWKVDPKVKMIIAFKEASTAMLVTQLGEEMAPNTGREKKRKNSEVCDNVRFLLCELLLCDQGGKDI